VLLPGEAKGYRTRKNLLPDKIRAIDPHGNVVYEETFTWEQLRAVQFRIVIQP
jgi:hypothetical protein